MKLLQSKSVEEIELVEYAENTEKSSNTIKVSEISIFTLEVEKLMRLLISTKKIFLMTKDSLLQKNQMLLSKMKLPKLDNNLEKFNCDCCNFTNSPEKGLTQDLKRKPYMTRKSMKKVTSNATQKMY